MNILLWILQILLAVHTLTGAVWKFSNSEQTVASLSAIPHAVWMTLSIIELLCAVAFILPAFKKSLGKFAPIAAICIAVEMLLFTVINISSENTNSSEIIYWIVVAVVCAFIAYGRFVLKPIQENNVKAENQ